MNLYNVATITVNQTPLDWNGNYNRILNAIINIKNNSEIEPNLFLFPELSVSGYGCEDAFFFPETWNNALTTANRLAFELNKILHNKVVVVGMPYNFDGALYNCSVVILNGKIKAIVPKNILANDGVHNELRWFKAFDKNTCTKFILDNEEVYFGSLAFEHENARFIIENCRDAWGINRPAEKLLNTNFDLVLHPTASCFTFDKYKLRRNIFLESSRRYQTTFLISNALGCEGGTTIFDGQIGVFSGGKIIFEDISYTKHDFNSGVVQIDLDINRIKKARTHPSRYFEKFSDEENFILSLNNDNSKNEAFAVVADTCPERSEVTATELQANKNEAFLVAAELNLDKKEVLPTTADFAIAAELVVDKIMEQSSTAELNVDKKEVFPTTAELKSPTTDTLAVAAELNLDKKEVLPTTADFETTVLNPNKKEVIPTSTTLKTAEIKSKNNLYLRIFIFNPVKKVLYNNLIQEFTLFEQFLKIQTLALFDYLRKSKSKGFVLPISGGCDSSCCAIIIHRMLASALNELGLELTLEKLGSLELLKDIKKDLIKNKNLKEQTSILCNYFLQTIYLRTKNNTIESETAAKELSKALNANYMSHDIQDHIDSNVLSVENLLNQKLDPKINDLAFQNIQARTRVPIVWMIANIKNSILICTANRSEVAVGYSTMDGDSAGGLAPLGGVSKSFLIEFMKFMQDVGDDLLGPVLELSYTNNLKPSAELKADQKDEEDLMPYDILDRIIILGLQNNKSKKEILEIMLNENFESENNNLELRELTLKNYIDKFFNLFKHSQWKRKRFAPIFYLDDLSLEPSHFRFPILNKL